MINFKDAAVFNLFKFGDFWKHLIVIFIFVHHMTCCTYTVNINVLENVFVCCISFFTFIWSITILTTWTCVCVRRCIIATWTYEKCCFFEDFLTNSFETFYLFINSAFWWFAWYKVNTVARKVCFGLNSSPSGTTLFFFLLLVHEADKFILLFNFSEHFIIESLDIIVATKHFWEIETINR